MNLESDQFGISVGPGVSGGETISAVVSGIGSFVEFALALKALFIKLCSMGYCRRWVVLVDCLDEVWKYSGWSLLDLLRNQHISNQLRNSFAFHLWVRIFLWSLINFVACLNVLSRVSHTKFKLNCKIGQTLRCIEFEVPSSTQKLKCFGYLVSKFIEGLNLNSAIRHFGISHSKPFSRRWCVLSSGITSRS